MHTAKAARRITDTFRYPPGGHRSWGGLPAVFGYRPPEPVEARHLINEDILTIAMIESPEAVANTDNIVAVEGIGVQLIRDV